VVSRPVMGRNDSSPNGKVLALIAVVPGITQPRNDGPGTAFVRAMQTTLRTLGDHVSRFAAPCFP
jgi:hypothetical protein